MTFCNNQDSSWPQVKVIPQGIGKYKENEKYVDLVLDLQLLDFDNFRPSPPVSWPRRHRSSTMTSEAAEEDLEVSGLKLDVNDNDDEQIRIEAWLDEHPEFFQEYLIRKGRKSFVHVPTYLFQNM